MNTQRPARHRVLEARGRLLVSTDLHGNGEDFRRLRHIFLSLHADDPDTQWVQLGDVVHAPNDEVRLREPALYGFSDESWAIVKGLSELMASHPGRVHFVLGNHDYGHIGGGRTNKFYVDEVAHLESTMGEAERVAMRAFFAAALIGVATPCGALLAHGSPEDSIGSLDELDRIDLPPRLDDRTGPLVLRSWLTAYGQPRERTGRLLEAVSRGLGSPLTFVVHGHDRDESGWFIEGGNQICPVIFGARRDNKRYLLLDLAAKYPSVDALRDGAEIRRLYEQG
jgi:hypothetical protein